MLPVQASGLVPIVEPEVLLDGDHDIDRTLEVALEVWAQTFKYMADQKVCLPLSSPLSVDVLVSLDSVLHGWKHPLLD